MKKHPVKLHITGTQYTVPDSTVSDSFVQGTMSRLGNCLILEYPEPAGSGTDEVITRLRYDGDLLQLTRNGEAGLTVERDRRHICQHATPFGSVLIGVSGGAITVSETPKRLDMEINYAIDINTSLASRNSIKIVAERLDI